MAKLLLIDGNSLIHRAYHALPPLSNSAGQPTNAVYGFAQMIWPLLENEPPDFAAVAFDTPEPTFRHELTPTYKATRPEMDEELRSQIELAKELVDALGMLRVERPGLEADDIIGTLAEQGRAQGYEVLIVSGDRDLAQLVKPGIRLLAPLKGLTDVKIYDEAAVREQYGVGPAQMADLKALAGDPSDNIPGVAGIGPVGAAKLLQQFGDIIELYDRLEEVTPESLRQRLETAREAVWLGRQLARIVTDVPLDLTEAQMRWQGPHKAAVRRLFARLEFSSLLERTSHWGAAWEGEIHVAQEAQLEDLCAKARQEGHLTIAPAVGPKGEKALALCVGPEHAWLWMLGNADKEATHESPLAAHLFVDPAVSLPACLGDILEDARIAKRGVRLKEAARLLWPFEVPLEGYEFDAEIVDYLLAPQRTNHSIMLYAAAELGWWAPTSEDTESPKSSKSRKQAQSQASQEEKSGKKPAELPLWLIRPAVEALAVERLRDILLEKLTAQELFSIFSEIEMPLARVLAEMERVGIAVDEERLQELDQQLAQQLEQMKAEIYQMAGSEFNLDSPKQVGEVLFGKLGLAKGKKTKTGYSTSAAVLEELAAEHEIVAKILAYRELAKLRSTYVTALLREMDPKTRRVHTTFEQTVTATGRLSSRGPNLQNIPVKTEAGRQIRSCFVAEPGKLLIKADYSQIELRLLAHFCGDESLRKAFHAGEDIHRRTAATIFNVSPEEVTPEMRRTAKTVNFAVLYGMGAQALSQELGISRQEAQKFIEQYFAAFPAVKAFMEQLVAQAKAQGYVTTIMGRRRPMPELYSPDRQVAAYAERAAANTPLQGSAADIVKAAMIRLAQKLAAQYPQAKLLLQVHDELVLEAPEEQAPQVAALVKEVMENIITLNVPLTVEVAWGKNWRDVEG